MTSDEIQLHVDIFTYTKVVTTCRKSTASELADIHTTRIRP